ncbi:ROK family transcriptional regulator [Microbispora siamensis]
MKTATPQLARAINDRLALDLLLERGPLTAPQLRALTGLSRPTVSDLIERLQVNGLIGITGESGGDRRGPNARLYGIVADRAFVSGVDVRRDVINVTVADITGATVGSAMRPLGDNLPALVADALTEAAGSRPLHAVVIGAPGLVDPKTGDFAAGNVEPAWRPGLLSALRTLVDAPIMMENEVNLAAVAEHATGAAAGRDDFVLLWLDDGIGAAVVLDGKVLRGASGGAGEIAFLSRFDITVCDLLRTHAVRGLDLPTLAERVAVAAFTLVAVVDPGLVVLGGATGMAGGDPLAALVAERLTEVSPVPVHVRVSGIPDNPVLRGAVSTALSIARDAVFGQGRR